MSGWLSILILAAVCAKLWRMDGRMVDWSLKISMLLLAFQLARIVSTAMSGVVQA